MSAPIDLQQVLSAYSVFQIGLVIVVAMVAAVVGAVGGFGTGVLLTTVLVPILGIKATIPVLGVAGIIINAGRFAFYFREVNWAAVKRVLPPALVFLWLGVWLFAWIPARPLTAMVGLLVICFVPLRRYLKASGLQFGPRGLVVGGGVFGVLTGLSTGAGVWLIALLLGAGIGSRAVVATDAFITIVADLVRSAAFQRVSLLDQTGAILGILIGLVTIPGSALGAWLVRRLDARLHTALIEGLIIFGGLTLLWNARS